MTSTDQFGSRDIQHLMTIQKKRVEKLSWAVINYLHKIVKGKESSLESEEIIWILLLMNKQSLMGELAGADVRKGRMWTYDPPHGWTRGPGPLHILLPHLSIQLHQHMTAAHKWTTQAPGPPTFVNVEQACVEIVNRTSAHCVRWGGPLNARQQSTGEECFMVKAISHKAIACYSWAQPCNALHSSITVSTNHSYRCCYS